MKIALIGFGEAGSTFAHAANWSGSARGYDKSRVNFGGITGCASNRGAVTGADAILSLVTADQALAAAQETATSIARDALFFDMNSVAPDTKREAASAIHAAGGRYVDVAIMAPVNPQKLAVPLLVSGPHAEAGVAALMTLGFSNVRSVGDQVGRASTIKMLRSVMYKGVEALTAECLIACERAGVTDEVLGSFGNDWSSGADYRLDRMMMHGTRRSAEMAESVKTLEALGVEPLMTRGTVERQREIGALGLSPVDGLTAKLTQLNRRCEERSDEAIQNRGSVAGLPRFARNDGSVK
jgi:3-hydroxyisobutyrate dehydrogenase-like beta-hydroxyacid dehydrogenase